MVRPLQVRVVGILALALLLLMSMQVLGNESKGVISSVAPDDLTFAITDEGGNELDFRMYVTGRVFINDEERDLSELQAGDDVTVTFDVDDNKMIATEVRARRN